jgi:hypothetical protein
VICGTSEAVDARPAAPEPRGRYPAEKACRQPPRKPRTIRRDRQPSQPTLAVVRPCGGCSARLRRFAGQKASKAGLAMGVAVETTAFVVWTVAGTAEAAIFRLATRTGAERPFGTGVRSCVSTGREARHLGGVLDPNATIYCRTRRGPLFAGVSSSGFPGGAPKGGWRRGCDLQTDRLSGPSSGAADRCSCGRTAG